MTMIDGGALVGKALANEGVEKAFVLCGGHIMPIFYGMRNAGIEIIDMRHECAAVYAAIAYTRASGKMAVVVTTAGPGVGNTPAGMMEAESLGIPLLQIGGAVAMTMRDAGDLQDMSTLNCDGNLFQVGPENHPYGAYPGVCVDGLPLCQGFDSGAGLSGDPHRSIVCKGGGGEGAFPLELSTGGHPLWRSGFDRLGG